MKLFKPLLTASFITLTGMLAQATCSSPYNDQLAYPHFIKLQRDMNELVTYRILDVKRQHAINAIGIHYSLDEKMNHAKPLGLADGIIENPICLITEKNDRDSSEANFYIIAPDEDTQGMLIGLLKKNARIFVLLNKAPVGVGDAISLSDITISINGEEYSGYPLFVKMASQLPSANPKLAADIANIIMTDRIDLRLVKSDLKNEEQIMRQLNNISSSMSDYIGKLAAHSKREEMRNKYVTIYSFLMALKENPPTWIPN